MTRFHSLIFGAITAGAVTWSASVLGQEERTDHVRPWPSSLVPVWVLQSSPEDFAETEVIALGKLLRPDANKGRHRYYLSVDFGERTLDTSVIARSSVRLMFGEPKEAIDPGCVDTWVRVTGTYKFSALHGIYIIENVSLITGAEESFKFCYQRSRKTENEGRE